MVKKQDIFAKITKEDLANALLIVANTCRIEVVRELLRHCAGLTIYIPKISYLDKFISRYIRENSEKNFKIIAR